MRKLNGIYIFDSREDVMEELLHGKESGYLVGFECPECQRLHVMTFTPRMIVFTDLSRIQAPSSVQLTVEEGTWGLVPPKFCPADGTPMRVFRTANNELIF